MRGGSVHRRLTRQCRHDGVQADAADGPRAHLPRSGRAPHLRGPSEAVRRPRLGGCVLTMVQRQRLSRLLQSAEQVAGTGEETPAVQRGGHPGHRSRGAPCLPVSPAALTSSENARSRRRGGRGATADQRPQRTRVGSHGRSTQTPGHQANRLLHGLSGVYGRHTTPAVSGASTQRHLGRRSEAAGQQHPDHAEAVSEEHSGQGWRHGQEGELGGDGHSGAGEPVVGGLGATRARIGQGVQREPDAGGRAGGAQGSAASGRQPDPPLAAAPPASGHDL